jgi:hypothetical protein
MRNVQAMQIFNSIENLIKDSASGSLLESDFSGHHSKEFSLFCELSNDVNEFCRLDYFIQIDYVGVSNLFHDFDFSLNAYFVIFFLNGTFINYFYSYFFASGQMDTFFDFAEGSLAQGFSELVIPYPCTDFFLTAAFLHAFDSHLI